jgi:hypothetical protein
MMLKAVSPRAMRGDVKAIGAALRISERRAKLLGLDAPVRKECTGADGDPIVVVTDEPISESECSQCAEVSAQFERAKTGQPPPTPNPLPALIEITSDVRQIAGDMRAIKNIVVFYFVGTLIGAALWVLVAISKD